MRPLNPNLWKQLQNVLERSFNRNSLLQLATVRLVFDEVRFVDLVDFGKNDDEIAFQIIKVAEERGYVEQLIRVVEAERPGKPEVAALVQAFELLPAPPGGGTPPSPNPVRDAIIRFNDRFQQRQELFRYLNASKQLHDLLHDLQQYQKQIETAATAARRPGDDRPDPTSVTDTLQLWVVKAWESARATEFPDSPPRWIKKFERAVADLTSELTRADPTAVDGARLDRSVAILAQLPVDEQRELNEQLVQCAMRLKTADLIGLMNGIRTTLGTGGAAPGADDLRTGVEQFQGLCEKLAGLIQDHNLCQEVDGALREAAGLPQVTPDRLSQWAEIKGWLQQIADRRPTELQATRPVQSVKLFEEAAAAGDRKRTDQVFTRLLERFNDLFLHTDKDLLEVTRDLLAAARVLDATLKRYL